MALSVVKLKASILERDVYIDQLEGKLRRAYGLAIKVARPGYNARGKERAFSKLIEELSPNRPESSRGSEQQP